MSRQRSAKKRDPRQERLERGRGLLAAWGVHEGTLPEGTPAGKVFETLAPLIGRDPACDLLIAEWLGRLPLPEAAARLASWEPEARDKELKRELRRSLFKLEQKGLAPARREEPVEPFRLGATAAEPEGYLGPVDGEGSRLACLVRSGRGGATGLLTVINDLDGMIFVEAVTAKRQALMETLKESSSSGPLSKVPWKYADALMHAAFKTAPPRPGNMRANYLLSRGEITSADPEAPSPSPVHELARPEGAAADELLEKSAALFKEREFRTWILPERIARVHLQRFANSQSSGLVLSKEAATERVVVIMDEALDELVSGPLGAAYARRMEEMAYLFHLQGRTDAATMSLAVAGILSAPEGRRIREVSFLRGLVFRAFAPYLVPKHESEGPAEETAAGSSVILDPSKASLSSAPSGSAPGDSTSSKADRAGLEGGPPPLIIRP